MEGYKLERIKMIADKELTYNKDINLHIESCRFSMEIINKKDDTINILRNMLERKDEELRKIEENNLELRKDKLIIEGRKDIEIKELKNILKEQYKLIDSLMEKINKN